MAQSAFKTDQSLRDSLFVEIVQSLKVLPAALRQVFIRSHYQGQNAAQIGSDLGMSKERVKSMLVTANRIFYRNLHDFHPDR